MEESLGQNSLSCLIQAAEGPRKGEHVADPHMHKCAEARNGSNGNQGGPTKITIVLYATPRPLYGDEISRFKAVVRQIARREMDERQAALFLMEDRSRIRRLTKLGVYGHQPGIAAHLETTPDEDVKNSRQEEGASQNQKFASESRGS